MLNIFFTIIVCSNLFVSEGRGYGECKNEKNRLNQIVKATTTTVTDRGFLVLRRRPPRNGGCSPVMTTCTPASGSFFPVGTTTVTCIATDAAGNMSPPCQFNVTVNDTEAPTITCPADISVPNDPGQNGAIVNFTPIVSDNCPGVTFECNPPSGSFFPLGTTTVTCNATDAAGNTASCSFNVTVFIPPVKTEVISTIIVYDWVISTNRVRVRIPLPGLPSEGQQEEELHPDTSEKQQDPDQNENVHLSEDQSSSVEIIQTST
jgi:hypothetical protein